MSLDKFCWVEGADPHLFDNTLASLDGHPLQSAFWGNARKKVDGITQLLLQYQSSNGEITGLARVEVRSISRLKVGKIAWLPKGPLLTNNENNTVEKSLMAELKRRGFMACVTDNYDISQMLNSRSPRTIWLDLSKGLDTLWKDLDTRVRYSVKRAIRDGVLVRITTNPADVSTFFHLCNALSVTKGFSLPGSENLMIELICAEASLTVVEMKLYVAEIDGEVVGGAVVAKSGRNLHYFWGASDRRYSKYRVSEAIQWRVIQDGVDLGFARYDLEGIDPVGNPSVYLFKRKLGGAEIVLHGEKVTPLSSTGHFIFGMAKLLGRV